MLKGQWSTMVWPGSNDAKANPETGVDENTLEDIGRASVTVPDGFVRPPILSLSSPLICCDISESPLSSAAPCQAPASELGIQQGHRLGDCRGVSLSFAVNLSLRTV